jgi:hypothetical protein
VRATRSFRLHLGYNETRCGLAYYKGLLEEDFTLQQKAYEELEAIKPEFPETKMPSRRWEF